MGDEDVVDYGDDGRDEADVGNSDGHNDEYKEGDCNGTGIDDNMEVAATTMVIMMKTMALAGTRTNQQQGDDDGVTMGDQRKSGCW